MKDLIPISSLDLDLVGHRRDSYISPTPVFEVSSNAMDALERIKNRELTITKRIAEVEASKEISIAQTYTASEWLRHRAVGESEFQINTSISEAGRGWFGGMGKYLNVNTSIKIR